MICICQNPRQLLDMCIVGCFVALKRTTDKYRKKETPRIAVSAQAFCLKDKDAMGAVK